MFPSIMFTNFFQFEQLKKAVGKGKKAVKTGGNIIE